MMGAQTTIDACWLVVDRGLGLDGGFEGGFRGAQHSEVVEKSIIILVVARQMRKSRLYQDLQRVHGANRPGQAREREQAS